MDSLEKGIEVTEVLNNSPAEKLGIQVGDRIIKCDGWYIGDLSMFTAKEWAEHVQKIDKTIKITLLSNVTTKEMDVPAGRLGVIIKG